MALFPSERRPNLTPLTVQEESKSRTLLLVSGFIHDASDFLDNHPGGRALLTGNSGKDATAAFFGGVYSHSHAAHNVSFSLKIIPFFPLQGEFFFGHPVLLLTNGMTTSGDIYTPPILTFHYS